MPSNTPPSIHKKRNVRSRLSRSFLAGLLSEPWRFHSVWRTTLEAISYWQLSEDLGRDSWRFLLRWLSSPESRYRSKDFMRLELSRVLFLMKRFLMKGEGVLDKKRLLDKPGD